MNWSVMGFADEWWTGTRERVCKDTAQGWAVWSGQEHVNSTLEKILTMALDDRSRPLRFAIRDNDGLSSLVLMRTKFGFTYWGL